MNDITLTTDQQRAVDAMLSFTGSFFTLAGYAGTGKTVALQHFAMESNNRIVFTAPTNKATKVMRTMARNYGLNTPCMTIHSADRTAPATCCLIFDMCLRW
jgi:superfamily I DNA and RNA helicase